VARPKSEDKRNAILSAATRVFAESGLGAPTSAISSAAGVAEGTLFTYFPTKDDLVNALYREIKLELADAMMSSFPRKKSLRTRIRHIWDSFVEWGAANPESRKFLALVEVSDRLIDEAKQAGAAPFLEIKTMIDEAAAKHIFQNLPQELAVAAMQSLATTTMELTALNPSKAAEYQEAAFGIFWSGITTKK